MFSFREIYDISVRLGDEAIAYPGDPAFERTVFCAIPESGVCEISKLSLCAHSGAHIDTPAHFFQNGRRIDEYPVSSFILPAIVVEISDKKVIQPADFSEVGLCEGAAVLFKTENSLTGICCNGAYSDDYVYLSPEAAEFCVQQKLSLAGIDYLTIEQPGNDNFPAHKTLLKNNVLILESIRLDGINPGEYTLICLPLKIKNGEASPVRAVLLR